MIIFMLSLLTKITVFMRPSPFVEIMLETVTYVKHETILTVSRNRMRSWLIIGFLGIFGSNKSIRYDVVGTVMLRVEVFDQDRVVGFLIVNACNLSFPMSRKKQMRANWFKMSTWNGLDIFFPFSNAVITNSFTEVIRIKISYPDSK